MTAAADAALSRGLMVELLAAVLPRDLGVLAEIGSTTDVSRQACCGDIREVSQPLQTQTRPEIFAHIRIWH